MAATWRHRNALGHGVGGVPAGSMTREGGRAEAGDGLENRWRGDPPVGSNPTPPAHLAPTSCVRATFDLGNDTREWVRSSDDAVPSVTQNPFGRPSRVPQEGVTWVRATAARE